MDAFTETALSTVASAVTADPTVIQERSRAAALVDAGYSWLDTYDSLQPILFIGSILGLAASGYALYKRPKSTEAVTLYSLTSLLCAGGAWFTRPAMLRPTPSPAAASASSPAMVGALTWLDNRVAARTAEQRGWETVAWSRLAHDTGHAPLDPALATLLTANSR